MASIERKEKGWDILLEAAGLKVWRRELMLILRVRGLLLVCQRHKAGNKSSETTVYV
jgi:hypothetical protein